MNISQIVKFFFEKNKKNLSNWIESLRKKIKKTILVGGLGISQVERMFIQNFFLIICQILAIKKNFKII